MRYGPDVIDAVLFDQGEPRGVLSVPEEELPRIGEAIRAGTGMEYQKATETEPGIYDLGPTPAASPASRAPSTSPASTVPTPSWRRCSPATSPARRRTSPTPNRSPRRRT